MGREHWGIEGVEAREEWVYGHLERKPEKSASNGLRKEDALPKSLICRLERRPLKKKRSMQSVSFFHGFFELQRER